MRLLWETGEGCLSVQVLQELYVAMTRKVVTRPLAPETARALVADLSRCRTHAPTPEDVLGASICTVACTSRFGTR